MSDLFSVVGFLACRPTQAQPRRVAATAGGKLVDHVMRIELVRLEVAASTATDSKVHVVAGDSVWVPADRYRISEWGKEVSAPGSGIEGAFLLIPEHEVRLIQRQLPQTSCSI